MKKEKYLWLTDVHLLPWKRKRLLNIILNEKPHGVFLTGDISYSSQTCLGDLEYLGKKIGRPLYFVLGNHDYHFSSFHKMNEGVKTLCSNYRNLIWMDNSGIQELNEETAVIGNMGWYDALKGDTKYLKYTFDWYLIEEFKKLPSMKERIEFFREIASESAKKLSKLLKEAVEKYKTIYLLTHVPPWPEANRDEGTIMEKFWEPYNVNLTLGEALEKVMKDYKKRQLVVLGGHTHSPVSIHVSRNIECRVGKASYFSLGEEERIYI